MADVEKMARDAYEAERYSESAELYRRAAECHRSAKAAISLGFMYAYGNGMPKSEADAVKWWHKAAAFGNAWGIVLAAGYEHGAVVSKRFVITNDHGYMGCLVKAYDGGYAYAAHAAGWTRMGGHRGTKVDRRDAYRWFLLGTASGDTMCRQELAAFRDG